METIQAGHLFLWSPKLYHFYILMGCENCMLQIVGFVHHYKLPFFVDLKIMGGIMQGCI